MGGDQPQAEGRRDVLISEDPREALIWQDIFAEILALMSPQELVIAVLRLEGLHDGQIAELLAEERATVCIRMTRLQQRIVDNMPEMGSYFASRQRRRGPPPKCVPLDRGWICNWEAGDRNSRRSRKQGS